MLDSGGAGLSAPLQKKGRCGTSFSMASNEHMARFEESTFYVELVGNVASHAGLHVGLIIFRYIRCWPFPRMRHLLCLEHRKQRLEIARLDTESMLLKFGWFTLVPAGKAFGDASLVPGEALATGGVCYI